MERQDLSLLVARTLQRAGSGISEIAARTMAEAVLLAMHAANLQVATAAGQPVPLVDPDGNRRSASRRRMLRTGLVVHSNGSCSLNCTVLDMSDTGVRLRLADSVPIPKHFTLSLSFEEPRECELVWRKDTMVGARLV